MIEFELTAQPQSNKFVVESKKPLPSEDTQQDPRTSVEWPFKMVCEHLCMDLFDHLGKFDMVLVLDCVAFSKFMVKELVDVVCITCH